MGERFFGHSEPLGIGRRVTGARQLQVRWCFHYLDTAASERTEWRIAVSPGDHDGHGKPGDVDGGPRVLVKSEAVLN